MWPSILSAFPPFGVSLEPDFVFPLSALVRQLERIPDLTHSRSGSLHSEEDLWAKAYCKKSCEKYQVR